MAKADYEALLLSAVLHNNDFLPLARSLVSPNMLKDQSYKALYQILIETYRSKGSVDSIMVADQINDLNVEIALRNVLKFNGVLTEDKLETYSKEIIRRSQIGKLQDLALALQEETRAQSSVSDTKLQEILSRVHAKLFDLSGTSTYTRPDKAEVIAEMKKDMLKYSGRSLAGYDTGFDTLNTISRGLEKEKLWVVGAYTSVGKSWFSLKLATNLAKNGVKVLYLSTEMSEKSLYWRMATILSGIPENKLIFDNLDINQEGARRSSLHEIQSLPIEMRSGVANVNDAIFEIRKGKAQGYCDVVIIDFLQNLADGKEEYQEITSAVRKLQNLAQNEKVAIVLASQNNRESQKSEFEALYGFKGSGAIEQAADIAIVLSRHKENKQKFMLCDVMKNRSGMTGQILYAIDFKTGKMEDRGFYEKDEPLIDPIPDYLYDLQR